MNDNDMKNMKGNNRPACYVGFTRSVAATSDGLPRGQPQIQLHWYDYRNQTDVFIDIIFHWLLLVYAYAIFPSRANWYITRQIGIQ